jgi:signal transduction histidine kinase
MGDAPPLVALVPDRDTRRVLRDRVLAGLPWEGEVERGENAIAIPLRDSTGAVLGILVERGTGVGAAVLVARVALVEQELWALRRAAAARSCEVAVAVAAAQGSSMPRLAALALAELETVIPATGSRVTVLEADALVPLAARQAGRAVADGRVVALSSSPAAALWSRKAPIQGSVTGLSGDAPDFATRLEGDDACLLVPLLAEEGVVGALELVKPGAFAAEDVAVAEAVGGVLGAAVVRERVIEQATRHAHAMELRAAARGEELDHTMEQLVQAAKLSSIGELAAGLVHELNQPLNVVGGYVELLREGMLDDRARERALDVMNRAVGRMSGMIDNLRNFSRTGGPALEPVDLAQVIAVASELTAGALKRGVRVVCPAGLQVLGDANRLEQVLVNLLANALQAEGDPVSVTARAMDEGWVAVEVADRGPGVPESLRSRVFEPFFTTKPPGQGTGLGLSVSVRIVQEHGGRIEVEDNPGGGSVFRVVLPRCRAAVASD